VIAFLGLGAYRRIAARPEAQIGPQATPFAGVPAWALPNPSGLNAHYQLDDLARHYRQLARALEHGG
jgi:TDG/mug DNA glycosylase family protein